LEQVEPILATFNARKELVIALTDRIADLGKASRQEAKSYLEGFYSSVKNQKDVKGLFVEGCSKASAM
jgi:hypothetical protein